MLDLANLDWPILVMTYLMLAAWLVLLLVCASTSEILAHYRVFRMTHGNAAPYSDHRHDPRPS